MVAVAIGRAATVFIGRSLSGFNARWYASASASFLGPAAGLGAFSLISYQSRITTLEYIVEQDGPVTRVYLDGESLFGDLFSRKDALKLLELEDLTR